ncbi:serine/threonine-protein kinase [Nannocystaceae bacterium ST9]
MNPTPDPLREAAPAYDDHEAKRARAGVAAALFGGAAREPVRVGRYELVGRLGSGGMGVVHRAHDPELDRPVAVKLLRPEVSADGKARARMLREARSLAKLSHPNVITVYDVGTIDGEDGPVFVAMELVAGKDLRRWLADRRGSTDPSAWIEVLERFLAAGRGLEAAHEAGLIHRDFKPENVLVGDDGRVRVLDFGLARVSATLTGEPSAADANVGPGATGDLDHLTGDVDRLTVDVARLPTVESRRAVDGSLTETGAVLGTPLYMAPELYAGQPADATSDQFAFCASLWEGIYGRRPFGADTLVRHVEAVKAGEILEPPTDSPVPIELHRIAARGLDPNPRKRWPDMHALLHELEQLIRQASSGSTVAAGEPAGSGWRWLLVVAIVLAAVIGLVGLELGLFGNDEPPAPAPEQPDDRVPDVSPEPSARGDTPADPTSTTSSTGAAANEPGDAQDDASETSETGATADPIVPTNPTEPSGDGWCHLHEDSYTLLARTAKKRANLDHAGTCYVCRVERRSSRTQNFSPRDCAGYSLCGATAAEDCR